MVSGERVGTGGSRPIRSWLCIHFLGKSLFLLAERWGRRNCRTLLHGDALHKFKWSNSYDTIQVWLDIGWEELVISCCLSPHLHLTLRKDLKGSGDRRGGPALLHPSPAFFPIVHPQSYFILSNISYSLQGKQFLGRRYTSRLAYASSAEGKNSHESTWKGRGFKELVTSLRDSSRHRPRPTNLAGRCGSSPECTAGLLPLHRPCKFLLRTELIFFFLRFFASRNEMRHSNSFP